MEEKKLTYKDVPMGYPLCFNDECAKKASCMHYQAQLTLPEGHFSGPAVFPTAWQDGECKCFHEKRFVLKAWGFTNLYQNVRYKDKADAHRYVRSYFSRGCGPYYRYHHGDNLLSPEQQEDIMKIIAQFGSTQLVIYGRSAGESVTVKYFDAAAGKLYTIPNAVKM